MSRGFGHTKRRIAAAKRQKREEKRLKKLNRSLAPAQPSYLEMPPQESASPDEQPVSDSKSVAE